MCILQVYFAHVIPFSQLVLLQTFHLEVFVGNELIQILQIYDCLVPAIFFAVQKQTAVKFPFWVTKFWNWALFQVYLFLLFLFLLLLERPPVLDPLQEEFSSLLLKRRVLDLLPIVSKLGEIPSSSLLGQNFHFFCLENNFFKIGWTWVNFFVFIITGSEMCRMLWEGSFLLEQNVFTVVVGPEFLPPIMPSLIKWGTLSKGSLSVGRFTNFRYCFNRIPFSFKTFG